MSDDAQLNPREIYRNRIAALTSATERLRRQHVWLGYLRLGIVAGGAWLAWLAFHDHRISRWWVLVAFALFVVVARRHSAVLAQRAQAHRAIAFFERGVARIEDRWAELASVQPAASNTSGSLFADDLDLFRRGGLFDLLDTARTSAGQEALSSWLLAPAARETILARQATIAELRERTELREQLASCGDADFEQLDLPALSTWGERIGPTIPDSLQWIAPLLAVLTIAAAAWFFATDRGLPLLAVVIVDATITFALQRRTQTLFVQAERASESLRLASKLIAAWQQQDFSSPLLQELQRTFVARDQAASALGKLARLTLMMEQRANYIVRIFDAPLMYSVQLAGAAQAWRAQYGGSLAAWLRTLGELEGLTSLATYSFEHPNDPFPQLCEGVACFDAAALGHPLLAESRCVRNDVALGGETRLLLVSGSNMSGKSTLLRSVGINAVLAMAGAPVRAASLRMTPLQVGASIQVNDSLREGRSRFYSEILRLRAICALAEDRPPALFLLDELLDGTNSSDRLTGARAIAQALLASGAIGLISTHDLALTEIGADEARLHNVHFEERIENGEMHFDFKLRDGVVTTRNGIALMRMIGLKI